MNNSLNDIQEYFSFQDSSNQKDDQSDQLHNNKDTNNINQNNKDDIEINREMEELYEIEKEIELKQHQIQSKKEELNILKGQFSDGKIIAGELNNQFSKWYSMNMKHNDIALKSKLEDLKKKENMIKMKEIVLESIMIQSNKSINTSISSSRPMNSNFKYEKPINKEKEKKKIIYQRNIIEYINKRDINQTNSKQNKSNNINNANTNTSNTNSIHNDISNSNTNNNYDHISPSNNKRKLKKNASEFKKIAILDKSNNENSFICDNNKQNKINNIRTCSIDLNAQVSSNHITIIPDLIDENMRNKNKRKKKPMMMTSSKKTLSIEDKYKSINESFIHKEIQGNIFDDNQNNISVIISKLQSDQHDDNMLDKPIDEINKSNNSLIMLSRNTSRNEIPKNYSKVIKLNHSKEKNKMINQIDNYTNNSNIDSSNKTIHSKSFIDEKTKELVNQTIMNMNKHKAKKTNSNKSFDINYNNNLIAKKSRNGSIDSKKTSLLSGLLTRILREEKQRLRMKSCNTKAIISELENSMFVLKEYNGKNKPNTNVNDIKLKAIDRSHFPKLKIQNINRMINIPTQNNIKTKTNKIGFKDNIDDYIKRSTIQNEIGITLDSNNCPRSNKYKKIRVNKSLPHISYPDGECQDQSNISYVSIGNLNDNIVDKHIENNNIKLQSIQQVQYNNNYYHHSNSNKSNSNSNKYNNDENRSIILSANNSMKVLKENQENTNANTNTNLSQYSNKTPIKENKNDLLYQICNNNYNIGLDSNCLGSKSCSSIPNSTQVKINQIHNSAKEAYIANKASFFTNESKSENSIINIKKCIYDTSKLLKRFIMILEKNCMNTKRKINIIKCIKQYAGKTNFYYLLDKYINKRVYYNQLHIFFSNLRIDVNYQKRIVVQVEELPNEDIDDDDYTNVKCKSHREITDYQNNLNKLKKVSIEIKKLEVIVKEMAVPIINTLSE